MTNEERINQELARLDLLPLTADQVRCLYDPKQLEDAAGMLADLRDRCGVRLPLPIGDALAGPCASEDEARELAELRLQGYEVVTVDEMATDDSRSTGGGNEFYVTGYRGPDAALALADQTNWLACWVGEQERIA
jgi:hypothetical protein